MSLMSKTIGECLEERAVRTPNLLGVEYRDERYTWKEVNEISDFLAVRYKKTGIAKGSHVAIWGVNSPNWVLTFFGLVKLGAIPVLVNTCYKENELKLLLIQADVEYLFYGSGCKSVNYLDIIDKISCLHFLKLKRLEPLEKSGDMKWYQRSDFPLTLDLEEEKILRDAVNQVHPMDTACILFTSGTTSRPKGVMLSHYSLVNNSLELGRQMHWNASDKICLSVPLFHCFGITAGILVGVHTGASVHLLKYYKTIDVLEEIQTYRCTILNGVPTMYLALMRNTKRKEYNLTSIKSGIIAGSPILPEEYMDICRTLCLNKLQTSFGQTESSPCITISDYDDTLELKSVTAGKVISDVELRIWNQGENRAAEPGESGEIHTRGYHVMQGYYGMKEETDQTIDSDNWLHTGDVGYLDVDGYLHVTGRMKEMIIRGGENISPLEIEECIIQMKEVEAVRVVGVESAVLQEEIVACIILRAGAVLDAETVKAFVKERLADYKIPKYVEMFHEFPMNAGGKILLKELRIQAGQMIEKNI